MTNEGSFSVLGQRCRGGHKHIQLKGTERVWVGGETVTRNKTTGAGAYPMKLCRLWAQVARQIGPEGSRGSVPRHEIESFESLLRETANRAEWKTQSSADEPDHPTWKGSTEGDKELIREAKDFIQHRPVIFGQYTKADIEREYRDKGGNARGEREETDEA